MSSPATACTRNRNYFRMWTSKNSRPKRPTDSEVLRLSHSLETTYRDVQTLLLLYWLTMFSPGFRLWMCSQHNSLPPRFDIVTNDASIATTCDVVLCVAASDSLGGTSVLKALESSAISDFATDATARVDTNETTSVDKVGPVDLLGYHPV
ncbi:unnamed protein product [Cuscuta europaea]|uniref:Uncharacterized protein n=1 Tax=Cuscuta europaea TaxID=41803 RepID=A0A9P0YSG8_CUSEU|nr:unnamed protein product [Cuscuta europaea]